MRKPLILFGLLLFGMAVLNQESEALGVKIGVFLPGEEAVHLRDKLATFDYRNMGAGTHVFASKAGDGLSVTCQSEWTQGAGHHPGRVAGCYFYLTAGTEDLETQVSTFLDNSEVYSLIIHLTKLNSLLTQPGLKSEMFVLPDKKFWTTCHSPKARRLSTDPSENGGCSFVIVEGMFK